MRRAVLAGLVTVLAGSVTAAAAQEAPRWTLTERDGVRIAHTELQSRAAVIVRCAARQFSVMLQGVPTPTDRMVVTAIIDGSVDLTNQWWLTDDSAMLMSRRPARFARGLAAGQTVSLATRSSDGRSWLVEGPLPADRTALDAVLSACDIPRTDPRDLRELPGGDGQASTRQPFGWLRPPRGEWPAWASDRNLTEGFVVLSCITGEAGRLEDCRVESELPMGGGFGREAVRSARQARLQAHSPVGVVVEFEINYFLR